MKDVISAVLLEIIVIVLSGCELRVARYGLRVTRYGLRVSGYGLHVAGCALPFPGYKNLVTGCVHQILDINYCDPYSVTSIHRG
jgi:hypothetical protein